MSCTKKKANWYKDPYWAIALLAFFSFITGTVSTALNLNLFWSIGIDVPMVFFAVWLSGMMKWKK